MAGPAAVIEAAYSVLEHMLMNLENKIVLAEMGACVRASERACACVRAYVCVRACVCVRS